MQSVCVITGGGSGMGLAAAKWMPKDKIIVLAGRTVSKLENAVRELEILGYEAHAAACDTSKRDSVKQLAEYACSLGEIKNVINSAGVSPNMADGEKLLRINALGTVYMNQEFAERMNHGSVILDIFSTSAYALPGFLVSRRLYELAEKNEERFIAGLLGRCRIAPKGYARNGLAYAYSKNFTVWYAQKCAFRYGEKGIRVLSLSPGLIDTDMENLEKEEGAALLKYAAEQRMGKPEELGYAIAAAADERNGYMAGVDILCDGGATNGKKFRKHP